MPNGILLPKMLNPKLPCRKMLEDHPRTCKWLGSAPFISHKKAICDTGNISPYISSWICFCWCVFFFNGLYHFLDLSRTIFHHHLREFFGSLFSENASKQQMRERGIPEKLISQKHSTELAHLYSIPHLPVPPNYIWNQGSSLESSYT